ncbi:Crp/Fnr family transcriptional regulator [Reichenbachiella sp.]|uniref:Crp/Fnr family transcriptional regulator n=1 Tax=Reichenbachiella sp. TaxID=2184521 RepID=UPI003B58CC1D
MKVDIKKFDFQSNRIIDSLGIADRELFLKSGSKLNFKKGKLIFYEGGIPTGIFLVLSGKAKIYKTGLDGKDQIFYIYKAGDLLGYHPVLCNEVYEDSCEALENCHVLFISKSTFENLLKKISSLNLLLLQNMSHEFGVMVNTITVLAHKPLRERLALYLLILRERYDGKEITVPREDLANIIGTARESLGRLLKEFKGDKLIEIKQRAIFLTDSNKLQRIASSEFY